MPFAVPDLPQTEAAIVELTNVFRAENRLGSVAPNPALDKAAHAFASYLAQSGAFAHTADGRQPVDRARAAGYHYCIVSENIALHQSNRGFASLDLARSAVEGWKSSPVHRANLLEPGITEIGIGIAQSKDEAPKFLAVQLLGRPDSFKLTFSITNLSGGTVEYTLDDEKRIIAAATEVRHTTCMPQAMTVTTGKLTSKFVTRDGAAFVMSRGPDGAVRVDLQAVQPHIEGPATRFHAVKAIKPPR